MARTARTVLASQATASSRKPEVATKRPAGIVPAYAWNAITAPAGADTATDAA
jgi:hypothetical protein